MRARRTQENVETHVHLLVKELSTTWVNGGRLNSLSPLVAQDSEGEVWIDYILI